MSLSDDEYTCLLIMKEGENLIRMRDTRWYAPLGSLHERGLVKPIGSENYIISQLGLAALVERDEGETAALRSLINKAGEVQADRRVVHEHMWKAVAALSEAAKLSSKVTGDAPRDALRKIAHEVLERALEKIA